MNFDLRYLALGDSYTIGEAVPEGERYPEQLRRLLAPHYTVELTLIARTGWTTAELDAAIDAANPQGPFHLVMLLIGVNNQYRGCPLDEYRLQFRSLLQRAIAFGNGSASRVIVLSIPDWGVTPFAADRDRGRIASEIDQFNAVNRDESAQAGAAWLDVTRISRLAAQQPDLLAPDGLHPSGKMYALWAGQCLPMVEARPGKP